MEVVDVQKELPGEAGLPGRTGCFTELHADKKTVPEGIYPAQVQGKGHEKRHDADGYETILTGAELIKFMEENGISFQMNEKEADLICSYMDGHGYVAGQKGGQLCRGALSAETDRIVWEETTIDDLVDSAMEWNYELLKEAKADMENPKNFSDFADKHSRYEILCADEKALDAMFDRTKYGEQIERVAEILVEQFVQNVQSTGDIDNAVKELAQGIAGGQGATVKQQAEQKKGRAR